MGGEGFEVGDGEAKRLVLVLVLGADAKPEETKKQSKGQKTKGRAVGQGTKRA